MHIDKFEDAIRCCRFCFMCRHLSGIGNVTFTEADTPRIRASLIWGLRFHPENWSDPDFIDTIYRSDLSAACRRNCVNSYDENGLNLAVRADIVEKGFAPDYVQKLAAKFKKTPAWKCTGTGRTVYLADSYSKAAGADKAFGAIMAKVKKDFRTISGGVIGKGMQILGFLPESRAQMKKFADFVNGIKADVLVVSNPAAYDALTRDFKDLKLKLNCKVMHSSEYILSLKLKFTKKTGDVYYLESDYLRNYDGDYAYPGELLNAVKAVCKPFGTNDEESYSCGEGAMLLPEFAPELVKDLAEYVAERADDPKKDVIIASPYTKIQLKKYAGLKVMTLEELAAKAL